MIAPEKKVSDLTVTELQILVGHPKYVYGIAGLAKMLGCGVTKAQQLKNTGKLNHAIIKVGKNLIFDAEAVIETFKTKK